MPFTISHAAAALPFLRSRLNFTALAIGAMSPDFEYILMFGFSKNLSHSLSGLFLFCLPVGLLFYVAYLRLWKTVMIDCMPDAIRDRIMYNIVNRRDQKQPGWSNILLSLFIGTATHFLLDAFSHDTGWGIKICPWLPTRIPNTPLHCWELSFAMLSLTGLILLFLAAAKWYRITPRLPHSPPRRIIFMQSSAFIIAASGIAFIIMFTWLRQEYYVVYRPTHIAANATLGLLIFLTLMLTSAGILLHLFRRGRD